MMRESVSHSVGSHPSLPGPSHPPQWASDGEEPPPHSTIRSDVSLIKEIEITNVIYFFEKKYFYVYFFVI